MCVIKLSTVIKIGSKSHVYPCQYSQRKSLLASSLKSCYIIQQFIAYVIFQVLIIKNELKHSSTFEKLIIEFMAAFFEGKSIPFPINLFINSKL